MTDQELYAMLDNTCGRPLDELIDQMREMLWELVPKNRFEEWDKKARAAQSKYQRF